MKTLFLILITLSVFFLAGTIHAKEVEIAYLGLKRPSTYLYSMLNDEINLGVKLAVHEYNKSKNDLIAPTLIKLKDYSYNRVNIDLLKGFDEIVDSEAIAVIGLSTSKEALIIGAKAQNSRILTVSIAASHDKVGEFGDYVFSGSGPISDYARLMAEKLLKDSRSGSVLMISGEDEPYLRSYRNYLLKYLKNKINLIDLEISKGRLLSKEQLGLIPQNADQVVLNLFALRGMHVLNQLQTNSIKKDRTFLVLPSWHFDQAVTKGIKSPVKLFVFSTWSEETSLKFKSEFYANYKILPKPADILGYDLTNKLIQDLNKTDPLTRGTLRATFSKNKYFKGVAGSYYFKKGFGHVSKPFYLYQLGGDSRFVLRSAINLNVEGID